MAQPMENDEQLVEMALAGNAGALDEVLTTYRARLKKFARFRLYSKIRRRIDESDVVQEALLDVARRIDEFSPQRQMSLYAWARQMVCLKIAELHRYHLQTEGRDANREMLIDAPKDQWGGLADQLVDSMTSPSTAMARDEFCDALRAALASMSEVDQEILFLRHFEQLSTSESAQVLGISKAGAGSRYLRALGRLRESIDYD